MARVVVVGPGRVGTALAVTLQHCGHDIAGAYCRDLDSPATVLFRQLTKAPVALIPTMTTESTHEILPLTGDVFLVTVPDKAVTATAQTLVDTGALGLQLPSHGATADTLAAQAPIVIHTAGSLSASALAPAEVAGARCICMHPLQTVASARLAPDCFRGVTFTLDGEATAIEVVSSWIRDMHAMPRMISGSLRSRYHAAAVLASNAFAALIATAVQVSGLDDGLEALLPLVRGAVDNLERLGLPAALTGPIERGDVTTVTKHLNALRNNPTAFEVYRTLGDATVTLAVDKGSLSPQQAEELRSLLLSGI